MAKAMYPKLEDRDWLFEQYVDLKLSSLQISEQLECNPLTVRAWLRRNNISIRKSQRPPTIFKGERFGKLIVIEEISERSQGGQRKFKCLCDCGMMRTIASGALRNGNSTSCGNCRSVHGHSYPKRSPTYNSWAAMLQRCYNVKYNGYEDYGGRGIKVCEKWKKFENFLDDMGVRPDNLSLDRIDVNGDYELKNCRWATKQQQARNKRCDRCLILENRIASLESRLVDKERAD